MKDVLDRTLLLSRVGGNKELLKEILQLCPGEFARLLAELETAVKSNDRQRIQSVAHTLKGSLGNLAAAQAHEAALRLEDLARKGDTDGTAAACQLGQEHLMRVNLAVARLQSDLNA